MKNQQGNRHNQELNKQKEMKCIVRQSKSKEANKYSEKEIKQEQKKEKRRKPRQGGHLIPRAYNGITTGVPPHRVAVVYPPWE